MLSLTIYGRLPFIGMLADDLEVETSRFRCGRLQLLRAVDLINMSTSILNSANQKGAGPWNTPYSREVLSPSLKRWIVEKYHEKGKG